MAALPPYTYVTGQTPHPVSDPRGHAYGHRVEPVPPLDPAHPEESPAWREACTLFNAGYYWEAHEAWESLWHAAGRTGPVADCLKGLIKWAAAGVKVREGRAAGIKRHCQRATELLRSAIGPDGNSPIHSVNVGQTLTVLEDAVQNPPVVSGSPVAVRPILNWTLK